MTVPESSPDPSAVVVDEAFFARARREAQRYGEDPWVFLRELVQNARDAQADTIRFTTNVDASGPATVEQVRCDDNGTGMSRDDVERFLLRLYASSKGLAGAPEAHSGAGPRAQKAGRFGVGFWSVLRFEPDTVVVETHDGSGATALVIDVRGHTLREVTATRTTAGTSVTLERSRPTHSASSTETSGPTLQQQVRRALRKTCGPVQGVGGRAPPRLLVDGVAVNRALSAGGSFATRITGDGFRGEVGLGDAPVVEIYAHGLLVREASSLDELQPAKRPRERARVPGLFPRVVVDAPGLTVLLDRQGVVEDEALDRLVVACSFALEHLEVQALDAAAPLSSGDAAVFWLSRFLKRQLTLRPKRAGVVAAMAAAGVALAGGTALGSYIAERNTAAVVAGPSVSAADGAPTLVQDLVDDGFSAKVDIASPAGAPARADLRYLGPDFLLFRTATLDRFEAARGLLPSPKAPVARLADHRTVEDDDDRVSYVLSIGSDAVVRMPVPLGYVPTRVSVPSGGAQNLLEPQIGRDGQALLVRPPAGILVVEAAVGRLTPWPNAAAVPKEPDLQRVRDDVTWGPVVARLRQLRGRARVEAARDAVAARLHYRTDPTAAVLFQGASGSWLNRVGTVGGGDCDILNGLVVVLVRAAGTPAHLGIGLVGQSGGTAPDLHAWVEAWVDGAWIALDATPVLSRLVPASDDVIALPGAIEVQTDRVARSWNGTGPPPPRPAHLDAGAPAALSNAGASLAPSTMGTAWRGTAALAALAALVVVALTLGALAFARRRRAAAADDVKRDAARLAPWFAAQLRAGRGTDPLGLWRRPYLPTRGGRLLSLLQVEERTARSLLLGAQAHTPLPPGVGENDVIALDDPRTQALLPSLPGLLDVASLGPLDDESRAALPAPLHDLEQRLRRLDPGVRLHARPGVALREARLPVRGDGKATGARHLFVGVDAPGVREALSLEDEPLRRFRLARAICAGTTALRRHEPRLLAELAAEALTDEALNPRSAA